MNCELPKKETQNMNMKTKFNQCETLHSKFVYILTCCNFAYKCTCDQPGYLYWCGDEWSENNCTNCCCLQLTCINSCTDSCRKNLKP